MLFININKTLIAGIKNDWFHQVLSKSSSGSLSYKTELIERLLNIITLSNQPCECIRINLIKIINLYSFS